MTRQEMRIRQEIEQGPATGGHGQAYKPNEWVGPTGFTRHIDEFEANTDFNTDVIVTVVVVDHILRDMMR